jgi:ABC-type lipoprotein export system ATPase subunit
MVEIQALNKRFKTAKNDVLALDKIDLKIDTSEFVLIKGESGSGKSTLLFTLGGMLSPSSGNINVNNKDLYALSEKERRKYRANEVGFVFQAYHLLPYLTVLENIMLPNKLSETNINKEDALKIAAELGLGQRISHKPSELSAGEKQRVALARALITNPSIILADEPTGNLDEKNAIEVMKYLKSFQLKGGTVIMVTHGHLADKYATRLILMDKGALKNVKK